MKSTRMETGLYLMITSSFKNLPKINSSLSIQLGLNGFSFFVSSQRLNSDALAYSFQHKTSEKEIARVLKDFILKHEVLHQNFSKVTLTSTDANFSLVPLAVYDENLKETYLNYNIKSLATDNIFCDAVDQTNIVFSIPNTLNAVIEQFYEINTYNHLNALLLKYLTTEFTQSLGARIFIYPFQNFFHLLILNGTELLFSNAFPYENSADFLYYFLFTLEQLNLDPASQTLQLLDTIDSESLTLLESYVFEVKISSNTPKNLIHLKNLQV